MAEEPIKKRRGRPPKKKETAPAPQIDPTAKRKPGRPRMTEEQRAAKKAAGIKEKPRGLQVALDSSLNPGENTKLITKNMEVFALPKIDMRDYDQVNQRIQEYFGILAKYDSRPTIAGLSMAFGISRQRLYEIVYNTQNSPRTKFYKTVPDEVRDLLRNVYLFMENLWEDYMLSGKINPVSGIFLAKNQFGYRDQTEYVLTPNQQPEGQDPSAIRRRYLGDVILEEEMRQAQEDDQGQGGE